MKKQKYNTIIPGILMLFALLFSSCDEDVFESNTPDQLFRPTAFAATIEGNDVDFSWVPIAGASYLLEISKDSLDFNTELQAIELGSVSSYSIEDLWSQTRYSARIKAVSKNPDIKDSEYKQITFITEIENIFYSVATEDIAASWISLKWDNTKDVSLIVVSAAGVPDLSVVLSAEEKAAGQKLIQGLNANTSYTFKIYLGEMLRGTVSAKTKS